MVQKSLPDLFVCVIVGDISHLCHKFRVQLFDIPVGRVEGMGAFRHEFPVLVEVGIFRILHCIAADDIVIRLVRAVHRVSCHEYMRNGIHQESVGI